MSRTWLPARYEFKYQLTEPLARRVATALLPHIELDPFSASAPRHEYLIRSLYFDTPRLACYHGKLAGVQSRLKVRLRTYGPENGDAPVFLELKHKLGQTTFKDRLDVPPEAPAFGSGERLLCWLRRRWKPSDKPADRRIWQAMLTPGLRPVVLVTYWREAYAAKGPARLRITFDRHIAGRSTDRLEPYRGGHRLRPALGDIVVLEVKFNGRAPAFVQGVVREFDLQVQAVSKYCYCLEASAPLFDGKRHNVLVDEGLGWPSNVLLYHTPRSVTPRASA